MLAEKFIFYNPLFFLYFYGMIFPVFGFLFPDTAMDREFEFKYSVFFLELRMRQC